MGRGGVDPKEVWMTRGVIIYTHTNMYFRFTYKSFWLTIGMVDDRVGLCISSKKYKLFLVYPSDYF